MYFISLLSFNPSKIMHSCSLLQGHDLGRRGIGKGDTVFHTHKKKDGREKKKN